MLIRNNQIVHNSGSEGRGGGAGTRRKKKGLGNARNVTSLCLQVGRCPAGTRVSRLVQEGQG